jgi:murein L,D-transpeptidase YcbB/YkuD
VLPALPALAAVLAESTAATGADDALAGLLQLWHGSYRPGGDDACTQATRQQLECVSLRSSLPQLREFNRPAVLLLSVGDGGLQHVLLRALQADTAQLQLGTREVTVGIADLVSSWYGDLILIWQPPHGSFTSLGRGSRGPAVRELRRRLLQLHGGALVGESGASYDQDLVNLVEDFQNQHHLAQDGIAGLATQLMLDSAVAAAGSPQLVPLTESP